MRDLKGIVEDNGPNLVGHEAEVERIEDDEGAVIANRFTENFEDMATGIAKTAKRYWERTIAHGVPQRWRIVYPNG